MVSVDRTSELTSLLLEKHRSAPSSSSSSSSRATSPARHGYGRDKGKGKAAEAQRAEHEFLKEAYRIQTHLQSLNTLLTSIRKPYLSTAPAPSRSRQPRPLTQHHGQGETAVQGEEDSDLRRYEGSTWLSDRERDEIDMRGRMILRRCRERVGVLEDGEKARQRQITPSPTSSLLHSLLPSLSLPSTSSSSSASSSSTDGPLITAHRASIIWYLSDALSKTTTRLSNMQEERSRRREERGRTLGGLAGKEAAFISAHSQQAAHQSSTFNHYPSSKATIQGQPNSNGNGNGTGLDPLTVLDPDGDVDSGLTPEQIQQFSLENNHLLEQMESTLSSVLSAEKSLLEISTLQAELVKHLASQTEMVERLYDEAVGSVADLGRGNEQLKKARKRGEEGRLFLVIFLLGASLALLFLNWYA